jgi:peptidoglycan/LPS O-acetylase OafA/YrhL
MTGPAELSRSKSALFNFIRWTAALVVVVGHVNSYTNLIHGPGTTAPYAIYNYCSLHAHAAVMVFFVLSGYFVTFATVRKCAKGSYRFRDYFLDRWSRIYSVLLAAIAFTFVLDAIGRVLSPVYSDPKVIPQDHFLVRLFLNVFSLQGLHGFRVQLGSNPPLWSIGYEFTFYVLFGLFFFRKQLFKRQVLFVASIALVLLLIGVKMSLYFLIWLLGVGTYYVTQRVRVRVSWLTTFALLAGVIVANHFINFENALHLGEYGNDFIFSVVVALFFLPDISGSTPRFFDRVNDFFAEYGYSIYAYHVPIVVFWYAIVEQRFGMRLSPLVTAFLLPVIVLVVARLLYYVSEARRAQIRAIGARVYVVGAPALAGETATG